LHDFVHTPEALENFYLDESSLMDKKERRLNDRTGKVLRTMGITFFALAIILNLLGGIGTSCAAFLTKQYPPFSALIYENMQWLYQGLVVTTVLIALVGIWVLIDLIRRKEKAFRNALIVLVVGTILAGI
jgi:hypothetical protein